MSKKKSLKPHRHVLLFFLDGVGLGDGEGSRNPFCAAKTPVLNQLLGEQWFLHKAGTVAGRGGSLIATDTCMGVPGRPQSASGQAALLTGINVPEIIGQHYGPKPTPAITELLENGNLFSQVKAAGGSAVLLNPYPTGYFLSINSGRRLPSAIQMAARSANLDFYSHQDLVAGRAISPDLTGLAWRDRLDYPDTPILLPVKAGNRMARQARKHAFSFFDLWTSDIVGHRMDWDAAVHLIQQFDEAVGGILQSWDHRNGLLIITSDHGNLEDLGVRNHTLNPVPTILVGATHRELASRVRSLTDIAPLIFAFLSGAE